MTGIPLLKIVQWTIIAAGLAGIGLSLMLILTRLEASQTQQEAQQMQIISLQEAIRQANELLESSGEAPVEVPQALCPDGFEPSSYWVRTRTDPNDAATEAWRLSALCVSP